MKNIVRVVMIGVVLIGLQTAFAQKSAQEFIEQVDASTLQSSLVTQLPAAVLGPEASAGIVDMNAFASVFGEEVQQFQEHPATDYQRAQTQNWLLEMQPSKGLFFAIEKEHLFRAKYELAQSNPPTEVPDEELIGAALEIMDRLGIQLEEMGPTAVRRVVAKTPTANGELTSSPHSSFVTAQRQFGEVPVINSNVTVSFNLDGSLHKVMGRWPKLAAGGHAIETVPNAQTLRQEVARQLAERRTDYDGQVLLSYLYDTAYNHKGHLRLALKAQGTFVDDIQGEGKIRHPLFDFHAGVAGE